MSDNLHNIYRIGDIVFQGQEKAATRVSNCYRPITRDFPCHVSEKEAIQ
jgi:hypothetical protein